jgi:hypothetical protein
MRQCARYSKPQAPTQTTIALAAWIAFGAFVYDHNPSVVMPQARSAPHV